MIELSFSIKYTTGRKIVYLKKKGLFLQQCVGQEEEEKMSVKSLHIQIATMINCCFV